MAATKQALFAELDSLVQMLSTEKRASNPADPGGYQGASSHPTASADNHGQSAMEGARSSENTSDVKEDLGGQSVDSTPELGADTQDAQQPNIGTNQSATGEDAATEDDYKGGKEDPGSSHPARTDNDSLDGNKYASASFGQLHQLHDTLANSVLADLANFGEQLIPSKTAAGRPAAQPTKQAAQVSDPALDAMAGYELAGMLGAQKQAAVAHVQTTIEAALTDALLDASLLGTAIHSFRQKQAAGTEDAAEGEDHDTPGDSSSGAGSPADAGPPGGGGAPPGMPPVENPGEAGLGGGGGAPGGLGDALGGGADPGGMQGPGKEEALMQLVAALDELGIPIEELAAMGGQGGQGGPGGDPSAMGGMPPGGDAGGPPPMSEPMKLASAAKAFRRSGKYQFKAAESGSRARQIRDQMKDYVRELVGA